MSYWLSNLARFSVKFGVTCLISAVMIFRMRRDWRKKENGGGTFCGQGGHNFSSQAESYA